MRTRTTLTVAKSELRNREFIITQLKTLCAEIHTGGDPLLLTPKEGKLIEFLQVLKFHKLNYGVHPWSTEPTTVRV